MSKIFICPTDTVIGIGGPVSDEVKKEIYKIKKRSTKKPLVILVSSIKEAQSFKGWNESANLIAQKYWPGALTIVLDDNISLRMPNHPELLQLIKKIGPIYMSSANISGQKPISSLLEAKNIFPRIKIYNFKVFNNNPSTIIDTKGNILRKGDIKTIDID